MARGPSRQGLLATAAVFGFAGGGAASATILRAIPGFGGITIPPQVAATLGAVVFFMVAKRLVR